MKWEHVHLEGFGYALPPNVVTSLELEHQLAPVYERFGVHPGRLELMSGIRERRFWDVGMLPSDASARAGRAALDRTDTDPADIEFLAHTSVSRDCLEPATAAFVHQKLSLPREAMMFDLSNACLGFANGMIMLANMIELGQVRRGLIVAGESSRQLVESTVRHLLGEQQLSRRAFKDSFASLTIGSGAVALVMAHESVSRTSHRLIGGVVRTDSRDNHLCKGTEDVGFQADASMLMSTDSEQLLAAGCRLAGETWEAFCRMLGWEARSIDRCFSHQVGTAHRDRLLETIGMDPAKDHLTFPFLGNVGSVSMPISMAMGVEQNPPADGAAIAMLGIGSGLSSIMLGVRW